MRRIELFVALAVVAALSVAAVAGAEARTVRDARADGKGLKRKPELDIRRATAANEADGRVKHKISMQGRLKPNKKFTRPFVLINTVGGSQSRFEYLLLGPRVLERVGSRFVKVGANKFTSKRRTWIYRFKPSRIGLEPGERYGWAAFTSKGRTTDLAPNSRYVGHRTAVNALAEARP